MKVGTEWKTKGLDGLLHTISSKINPWVASAIDQSDASYATKRILLRALNKEHKEREKQTWHWKDFYRDIIVEGTEDKEAEA